jgi:hypothetical protein
MYRFIPAAWRPSAFITAGATEQRRLSLSRLGSKLSVVSVFSFACKAALTALDFYGVLLSGSALFLALSTLLVEAAPTLLTLFFLACFYSTVAATRMDSLGTSLISKAEILSAPASSL